MQDNIKPIINVDLEELKILIYGKTLLFHSVNNSDLIYNLEEAKELSNSIFCFNCSFEKRIKMNKKAIETFSKIENEIQNHMTFCLNFYNSIPFYKDKKFFVIFSNDFYQAINNYRDIKRYDNDIDNDYDRINNLIKKSTCKKMIMTGFRSLPNLLSTLSISVKSNNILDHKKNIIVNSDCSLSYHYKIDSIVSLIESILFKDNNTLINITNYLI